MSYICVMQLHFLNVDQIWQAKLVTDKTIVRKMDPAVAVPGRSDRLL